MGKKYKPVAPKVWPVETELPSRFWITCNIKGNPLKDMLMLPTHLPPFTLTGRYTQERKEVIKKAHPDDFLLLEECALMHQFMSLQEKGFAWTDQHRRHFRKDFILLPPPSKYQQSCTSCGSSATFPSHPAYIKSMQCHQAQIRSGHIQALQLLISLKVVLRRQEGW